MIGWVRIYRQLLDHPLWVSRGRFSPGQAWVDLLLRAAHTDHDCHIGNLKIVEKRGQFLTSQLALSKRWGWNRKTVVGFLLFLKADMMLDIQTSKAQDSGYTLITIINYEQYQNPMDDTPDNRIEESTDIRADIRGTTEGQPRDTHKNGKNGKKNTLRTAPAGFDAFWAVYPKKRSKETAKKAWSTLNPQNGLVETILAAVALQKQTPDWLKDGGQFIPYAATWLHRKQWEDEIPSNGHGRMTLAEKYPRL